jgi:hypothetical protein
MTAVDELTLYHDDRPAWIKQVAERTARRLATMPPSEIAGTWPLLQRDYQRAIWGHLSEDERGRIREARAA